MATNEAELVTLLEEHRAGIVDEATESLEKRRLPHYDASPESVNRRRLERLHGLVVRCIRDRNLVPMARYAESLAAERYDAGFGVAEVQGAFNVFEEVVWRRITAELSPASYAEAFGLVSTVLGAGKEALAVEYVSLATESRVGSLDLTRLFDGG